MKKNMFQKVGDGIKKNSPAILTGMSIAGVVSTTVLAVRATPIAMEILDEYEEDLPILDKVKVAWKPYAPACAMGVVTIGCIVGSQSIQQKRQAAIAGVYSLTDRTLKQYQEKVIEQFGETKAKIIDDEVMKEKLKERPVRDTFIEDTGLGGTLCYDAMSGRYFYSDIESIKKGINELNRILLTDINMFVTLNDAYEVLGLESTRMGDLVGWHIDSGNIEPRFSSHIASNGQPCLVLDFRVEPETIGWD